MKKLFTLLSAMVVLTTAVVPGFAARTPAWVTGADPAYPDSTCITGVGVADELDGARASARAEISKVFQSHIQQTSSDKLNENSVSSGRKDASTIRQEAEVQTKISTDSLLEGVQIATTWFDKKKKKYYALAVLDKPKTRSGLSAQIMDKEEAVNNQLAQSKTAVTPLEKARTLAAALKLSREKDALVSRRRVVDPVDMPDLATPGTSSTGEIQSALDDTLAKIQFIVESECDTDSRLQETVVTKITDMGFKVLSDASLVSTTQNPVMRVKCRLKVEPFDRGNPSWKFFQWSGTLQLSEAVPNAKTLAAATPSGTEGHLTENAARAKTLAAGEEGLAKEAQDRISKYIFGQ